MDFDFNWHFAYKEPEQSAVFKESPEDFQVVELGDVEFTGEGEHLWLWVKKEGENTHWVADRIADWAGVSKREVGYAGRKDRHAITWQWFSVQLPGQPDPAGDLGLENVTIERKSRHCAKLKRGMLEGNRFDIKLKGLTKNEALTERLANVQRAGVPNYYGEQRFGHDFNNVPTALELGRKRRLGRRSNDIYLSAARSYLFNHLLSKQVAEGTWEGNSATLWGRGRAETSDAEALAPWKELSDILEFTGLKMEQRDSQLIPADFESQWIDNNLQLSFTLPAGAFATSVLREIVKV